ncbi:Slp family lipoprotein [Desulfonatronum thioautotrophicum]|uniref:Slp family lipoprotein n=1 Tax=Desulfonatronum thioautotrophicum TaxID=617001 RepID=UPI0009FEA08C|nr:Slp/YeaY family lipoprotein [Desulfonatronum thioautotrophicum]
MRTIQWTASKRGVSVLLLLIVFIVGGLPGCAPVISPELMGQADQALSFAELRHNPHAHKGRIVVLGGVIIQAHVVDQGTLLEIYQTRTNRRGEPIDLDRSQGRFLAFSKEFLDPAIYRQGRRITIAGRVEGDMTGDIGDVAYRYPHLAILERRLWPELPQPSFEPCPWYFSDPRDPWNRWHCPYPHPFLRPYSRW